MGFSRALTLAGCVLLCDVRRGLGDLYYFKRCQLGEGVVVEWVTTGAVVVCVRRRMFAARAVEWDG